MDEIKNMLLEHDCDAETISKLVDEFKTVGDEHSMLQDSIAMAILLKTIAGVGGDDPNEQLKLIFELADCYDINVY